jgi:dephospho-CoA kinase
MLTIGLTGGIASGKSAVSSHFSYLGAFIVDTDVISRNLVRPGMPALNQIETLLGTQFIKEDGELNRQLLRQHIFDDQSARKTLESILHPAIQKEISSRLSGCHTEPYAVVVIPLLAEKQLEATVDRVLLVDTLPEIQIQRLYQRDKVSTAEAKKILSAQASRSTRKNIADDIIDNSKGLPELHTNVERMHQQYLELAKNRFSTPNIGSD